MPNLYFYLFMAACLGLGIFIRNYFHRKPLDECSPPEKRARLTIAAICAALSLFALLVAIFRLLMPR